MGGEDPLEKGQAPHSSILGLPGWLSRRRIHLQCRRPGFDPRVGKIPWRRERLPNPVFWPGESHGLYSPWVAESDTTSDFHFTSAIKSLPLWLSGQKSACSAGAPGEAGSIPGSGRSPGRGCGNLLQYSCLENPMDRGAWQAIVHRIAKTGT